MLTRGIPDSLLVRNEPRQHKFQLEQAPRIRVASGAGATSCHRPEAPALSVRHPNFHGEFMDKVFEGVVGYWRGTFGFIDYECGSRVDSIFYPGKNVVPDNIGRTGHGKIEGSPVHFKITKAPHHGELKPTATEITPVFPSDVLDPLNWREISHVERIGPGCIYLRRQTGEQLFLHLSDVLPEFRDRFPSLKIGDAVFHGVRPSTKSGAAYATFRAVAAELFSPEEQEEIRCSEVEQ